MPQITKFTMLDTVKKKPQYKGCLLKYIITKSQGQHFALGVVPSGVNQYVIQAFHYHSVFLHSTVLMQHNYLVNIPLADTDQPINPSSPPTEGFERISRCKCLWCWLKFYGIQSGTSH